MEEIETSSHLQVSVGQNFHGETNPMHALILTSSCYQNCKKINSYCLSHPVPADVLLWQS